MSESNDLVIERTVNAPVQTVWNLWTQAEHFQQWYGPQGFTIPVAEIDAQVGGRRFVGMESPDGSMKMFLVGEHREVTPHQRLVYTEAMADEDGNVLDPAAMGMPDHPGSTEVTVDLEDLGDGTTKLTMTHVGVPADSPGAGGWAQALDKLAAYVAGNAS